MKSKIKLFSLKVAKWTSKIQGHSNTRQNCSRVDAAMKADFEFFVCNKDVQFRPGCTSGFSNRWAACVIVVVLDQEVSFHCLRN